MAGIFSTLDGYVSSFMSEIFAQINEFWDKLFVAGGTGAYISFLLVGVFLALLILIGLIKLIKKFGLFIFLVIITIGIPCLWYFIVFAK